MDLLSKCLLNLMFMSRDQCCSSVVSKALQWAADSEETCKELLRAQPAVERLCHPSSPLLSIREHWKRAKTTNQNSRELEDGGWEGVLGNAIAWMWCGYITQEVIKAIWWSSWAPANKIVNTLAANINWTMFSEPGRGSFFLSWFLQERLHRYTQKCVS